MYARQQTWIENGPGLGAVVIPLPGGRVLKYRRPGRRPGRGVGAMTGADCSFSSFWNPNVRTSDLVANCFERGMYGSIPTVAQLPGAPVPNAPQTLQQLQGDWSVDDSFSTPEQWAAWSQSQRDAIANAPGYTPDGGGIPGILDVSNFLAKYGGMLFIGGLALGGLALYGAVKR